MKKLKAVFRVKKFKNEIMTRLHHELMKHLQKENIKDVHVEADYGKSIITVEINNNEALMEDFLREWRSRGGKLMRGAINFAVDVKIMVDGRII